MRAALRRIGVVTLKDRPGSATGEREPDIGVGRQSVVLSQKLWQQQEHKEERKGQTRQDLAVACWTNQLIPLPAGVDPNTQHHIKTVAIVQNVRTS
jgi:hypothetical protein